MWIPIRYSAVLCAIYEHATRFKEQTDTIPLDLINLYMDHCWRVMTNVQTDGSNRGRLFWYYSRVLVLWHRLRLCGRCWTCFRELFLEVPEVSWVQKFREHVHYSCIICACPWWSWSHEIFIQDVSHRTWWGALTLSFFLQQQTLIHNQHLLVLLHLQSVAKSISFLNDE